MADLRLDLFGEPLTQPRAPGRPRHVATAERRDQVRALRAEGLTQPKIAAALGITIPTLVLHYSAELGSASQAWRRHVEPHSSKETYDAP